MQLEFGIHMKGGIITEREPDLSTVRIRAQPGVSPLNNCGELQKLSKRNTGPALVHCTTRQTIEIPHVKPAVLKRLAKELEKNGTPVGFERDEIVNIISCPGTERCQFANIDTISLAKKIDEKLFGKVMPVKMRIGISGCPNACTSPMLNEIGVIGGIKPISTWPLHRAWVLCRLLQGECDKDQKRELRLNEEKCIQCGMCVKSCWFNLLKSAHSHYLITVGGRRGRPPKIGRELMTVETEDQVIFAIKRSSTGYTAERGAGGCPNSWMKLNFEKFREEILKQMPEAGAARPVKN